MSLRIKVFFILFGFSLLLVLCMAGLMKWSFQSGFKDYIHQKDIQRLQAAIPLLEQYYAETNTWANLIQHPKQFAQLALRNDPKPSHRSFNPTPLQRSVLPENNNKRRLSPSAKDFLGKVYLLDADKDLLIGTYSKKYPKHEQAIKSNGNLAGYIGVIFKPKLKPFNRMDSHFAAQQLRNLLNICLLALAFSLVFSWPISAFLVKRIHSLGAYIRQLSLSRYDQRISVKGNDELSSLAEHLNNLAITLQKNEQSRRKLIADVSHELRTPLSILKAMLEAIEDGIHSYNSSTHQRLNNQVNRLHQLIEDLYQVSLSDLGALQYHKTECDLSALIDDTIADFEPHFQQSGLHFDFENRLPARTTILADPQRIHQLISNLIQNSLRYTQTPGRIQLSLTQLPEEKHAIICLQDSTPGIPDNQKNLLFEPFYRGESSRNREFGGAGLGLSLCKNIVDAHQGNIQVTDSELGGLRIIVTLPILLK